MPWLPSPNTIFPFWPGKAALAGTASAAQRTTAPSNTQTARAAGVPLHLKASPFPGLRRPRVYARGAAGTRPGPAENGYGGQLRGPGLSRSALRVRSHDHRVGDLDDLVDGQC